MINKICEIILNVLNKRPIVIFAENLQYNLSIGVDFKFIIPKIFSDPDGDKLEFFAEFWRMKIGNSLTNPLQILS